MSKLPSSPQPLSGVPENLLAKTEFEPRLCQELAVGQLLKLSSFQFFASGKKHDSCKIKENVICESCLMNVCSLIRLLFS